MVKMIKENKWKIICLSLATLLPIVIGLCLWNKLPDIIPIHFDATGQADGWAEKWVGVFVFPSILFLLYWLCIVMTALDPKHKNIPKTSFAITLWIIPSVSLLVSSLMYAYALEMQIKIGVIMCVFFGVLFIVIGNYMPKVKQNYSYGIKLPWTFNDEGNWNSTHRLAGKVWVACGLVILATSFLGNIWIVMGILAVAMVIPFVHSYRYYKKHGTEEKKEETEE